MTQTPARSLERLSEHVDSIAEHARTLQALLATRPQVDILGDIAGWCDAHNEGHGTFFEVAYGVKRPASWEVTVYLGGEYRHHKASPTTNTLNVSDSNLHAAAVAMLKLLENVAPKERASRSSRARAARPTEAPTTGGPS